MELLLIAILILVNGLFVMAEMALVSSRKGRLQSLADKGDRSARIALELINKPSRYLSTIQIVITISGIGLGMFGESVLAERLEGVLAEYPLIAPYRHPIALGITVIALTLVTLVFAELVPKRLGQINPEGFARLFARPMDVVSRVTSPLVLVLSAITDVILRVLPVRAKHDPDAAADEVKAIIASGTESGVFHRSEQDVVERVFRLSDQRVTAIMVPRTDIDFLNVSDSVERVRVAIATSAHSHFPVCDGGLDTLVGVVHVKDLVKHGMVSDTINLRDLAHPPMFVPESTQAIKLLELFRGGTHIAFVIDEYGAVIGLVTLNDLIGALVGEVTIKGEHHDPEIVKRDDGSFLLDGMLAIGELKSLMGVDHLPNEDDRGFETLGGFIMTHLGRIPSTGDRFDYRDFRFEVVDMDRTRVDKVLFSVGSARGTAEVKPAQTGHNERREDSSSEG